MIQEEFGHQAKVLTVHLSQSTAYHNQIRSTTYVFLLPYDHAHRSRKSWFSHSHKQLYQEASVGGSGSMIKFSFECSFLALLFFFFFFFSLPYDLIAGHHHSCTLDMYHKRKAAWLMIRIHWDTASSTMHRFHSCHTPAFRHFADGPFLYLRVEVCVHGVSVVAVTIR